AFHTIGSSDAGTIHQGVDHNRERIGGRWLEPETGEARELLWDRQARIDGDPAGRQAVLIELAGAAEIGGAKEGEPIRLIAGVHDAEPGETEVFRQLRGKFRLAKREQRRRVEDLAGLSILDDMQLDRRLEEAAEMEELDRKWPIVVCPQ